MDHFAIRAGDCTAERRCCYSAHSARASARARDHLQKFAGRLSEIARSESPKDGVPRFCCARIEDTTCGHQGLLRFALDWLSWSIDGETKGHSGRIKRELRAIGAARFDVPELLSAGKWEARFTVARK